MTLPVARKRVKHPKTRTGCRTCRIRRIKCDETRPQCQRCSTTGRHCLGYEMSLALIQGQSCQDRTLLPQGKALVRLKSVPRPLASFPSGLDPMEAQAFDFFRKQALYFLPGCGSSTTWETIAMRLSHSEPALVSAIVAVGSMHQARTSRPVGVVIPIYEPAQFEFAMAQYSRSVGRIQEYIDESRQKGQQNSVEVVLLACLLFICFEFLHGNNFLGILHLRTGLRILYEHLHGPMPENRHASKITLKAEPRSTIDLLSEIYVRLDCDASMFGQEEPTVIATVGETFRDGLAPFPKVFRSLEEARLHLDALTSAMYCAKGDLLRLAHFDLKTRKDMSTLDDDEVSCLVQAGSRMVDMSQHPELRDHLQALERSAAGWSLALGSMPIQPEHDSYQVRLLLEIQFFVVWIFISTWCDKTETMGDRFRDQHVHVLGLIEQYLKHIFKGTEGYLAAPCSGGPLRTFSLSHSVLLPLFLIAAHCRDSAVRRRALLIPSRLHIQESMMDSGLLAACLARIIDMEEDAARRINGFSRDRQLTCEDIPEAARYLDVTVAGKEDDVGGRFVCCRWADPQDEELTLEEFDFSVDDVTASLRDVSLTGGSESPVEEDPEVSSMQQWMRDFKFRETLYIASLRRQVLS